VPVYEYRCAACDTTFERRVAMADADVVQCPDGHSQVRRLLSVFATSGRTAPAAPALATPATATPATGGCGGHCACH
jgi:putative FmdB family regulatory protein